MTMATAKKAKSAPVAAKSAAAVAKPVVAAKPAAAVAKSVVAAKPAAAAAKPINKSQLMAVLSEKTGLTKAQVNTVLDSLDEVLKQQLGKKGPGVFQFPGLLKLQVRARPAQSAKKGRNPATGEEITIAAKKASKRIAVRPLKALKDAVL